MDHQHHLQDQQQASAPLVVDPMPTWNSPFEEQRRTSVGSTSGKQRGVRIPEHTPIVNDLGPLPSHGGGGGGGSRGGDDSAASSALLVSFPSSTNPLGGGGAGATAVSINTTAVYSEHSSSSPSLCGSPPMGSTANGLVGIAGGETATPPGKARRHHNHHLHVPMHGHNLPLCRSSSPTTATQQQQGTGAAGDHHTMCDSSLTFANDPMLAGSLGEFTGHPGGGGVGGGGGGGGGTSARGHNQYFAFNSRSQSPMAMRSAAVLGGGHHGHHSRRPSGGGGPGQSYHGSPRSQSPRGHHHQPGGGGGGAFSRRGSIRRRKSYSRLIQPPVESPQQPPSMSLSSLLRLPQAALSTEGSLRSHLTEMSTEQKDDLIVRLLIQNGALQSPPPATTTHQPPGQSMISVSQAAGGGSSNHPLHPKRVASPGASISLVADTNSNDALGVGGAGDFYIQSTRDSAESSYSASFADPNHRPTLLTSQMYNDDQDDDDDQLDGGVRVINNYVLFEHFGSGSYGEIFLAERTDDAEPGTQYAIKEVSRAKLRPRYARMRNLPSSGNSPQANPLIAGDGSSLGGGDAAGGLTGGGVLSGLGGALQREIAIMKNLRHKNIVPLLEVIDDTTKDELYLVMPFVERGPILELRRDGTYDAIDLDVARGYFRQIVSGVCYLHKQKVAHRDIKPDNILLGRNGQVFLADFGVSEVFDDDHSMCDETSGTPMFAAPECVSAQQGFRLKPTDVWALGVTLYVMIYGRFPFTGKGVLGLNRSILHDEVSYKLPEAVEEEADQNLKDAYRVAEHLIKHMLDRDPITRYDISQVKRHKFIAFQFGGASSDTPKEKKKKERRGTYAPSSLPKPTLTPQRSTAAATPPGNDDATGTEGGGQAGTAGAAGSAGGDGGTVVLPPQRRDSDATIDARKNVLLATAVGSSSTTSATVLEPKTPPPSSERSGGGQGGLPPRRTSRETAAAAAATSGCVVGGILVSPRTASTTSTVVGGAAVSGAPSSIDTAADSFDMQPEQDQHDHDDDTVEPHFGLTGLDKTTTPQTESYTHSQTNQQHDWVTSQATTSLQSVGVTSIGGVEPPGAPGASTRANSIASDALQPGRTVAPGLLHSLPALLGAANSSVASNNNEELSREVLSVSRLSETHTLHSPHEDELLVSPLSDQLAVTPEARGLDRTRNGRSGEDSGNGGGGEGGVSPQAPQLTAEQIASSITPMTVYYEQTAQQQQQVSGGRGMPGRRQSYTSFAMPPSPPPQSQ